MAQEQNREALRLAELAGIRLPDERIPGLVGGLAMARAIAEVLARVDYGDVEPACQFRAPVAERR